MRYSTRWVAAAALIITGPAFVACADASAGSSATPDQEIAKVEHVEGSDIGRVTLSADAARRLGIQTEVVRESAVAGQPRTVVPYAAVLYDVTGLTYAYANPAPLVFVRVPLTVDFVTGDLAVLTGGPPVGTAVVTVGASELFGTEFEVGD
jgi:hypothetical protein